MRGISAVALACGIGQIYMNPQAINTIVIAWEALSTIGSAALWKLPAVSMKSEL